MSIFSMSPLTAGLGRALVVSAIALIAPAQAETEPSELEARNEAIVRDAFHAWTNQTGNVFDILSPDVAWTIHGSGPVAGTYNGATDFIERGSGPLVSRLSTPIVPEVHHIWTADDRVIVRFDGSATTNSGAPYRNQFVWIFRLERGSVVEAEAFLDLTAYQAVVDTNQPRSE